MQNPYDGDLTFIGRILAELPVDIRVGKLMLLGHAFGMLEECIIIAAALTSQSFHSRPHKVAFEAYKSVLTYLCAVYILQTGSCFILKNA